MIFVALFGTLVFAAWGYSAAITLRYSERESLRFAITLGLLVGLLVYGVLRFGVHP